VIVTVNRKIRKLHLICDFFGAVQLRTRVFWDVTRSHGVILSRLFEATTSRFDYS